MKTCAYISGLPCAGKSTVAGMIRRLVPGIAYLQGDDEWRKHFNLPFEERVAAVNQSLLTSLRAAAARHVLCEWVPSRGLFLHQLYDACLSRERRFLHAVLTAPASILRTRKRERDGDEDIGPEIEVILDDRPAYDRLVFASEKIESSRIAEEIARWILSNQ